MPPAQLLCGCFPNHFQKNRPVSAMMRSYKPMDMVNFAVASSVIKHTIHGDANITDDAQTIKEIMNMNFDIKRGTQRGLLHKAAGPF